MACADRPDRVGVAGPCDGEDLPPSFRVRCADWHASASQPGPAGTPELLPRLVRIMDRALRALGDQGERDAACRMAAEAWALVESEWQPEARRLNGTLHYLTRRPSAGVRDGS